MQYSMHTKLTTMTHVTVASFNVVIATDVMHAIN